ncbi:MAG TPA: hypothetical protein VET23_08420 [Chitinophagaceae bacterium]|nr:hypothetical protein [Chitinophagaceae bacterium]
MKKLVLLFAVLLAVGISTKASDKIPGLKIDLPNLLSNSDNDYVKSLPGLNICSDNFISLKDQNVKRLFFIYHEKKSLKTPADWVCTNYTISCGSGFACAENYVVLFFMVIQLEKKYCADQPPCVS